MEISLVDLKELIGRQSGSSHSFVVGRKYLIRSVTMYYTGRLIAATDSDLVLEDAAWIANTGRVHTALTTGNLNEIEPFVCPVIIPRGCIVDATEWEHDLPRKQK